MQIVVSNISVEVIRKNIKNMHLSVLPPDGRVRVSAPVRLTDEAITMFVRTKLGWIKKQQEKLQKQPRQSERQYISGESLYVWGSQYFLQVEYSYKGISLVFSGDRAILTVRKELQRVAKQIHDHQMGHLQHKYPKDLAESAVGKEANRVSRVCNPA